MGWEGGRTPPARPGELDPHHAGLRSVEQHHVEGRTPELTRTYRPTRWASRLEPTGPEPAAEPGQVRPVLVLVPVASWGHAAGASNRTNGSKCMVSHSSGGESVPGGARSTAGRLAALQSCSGEAPQPRGSEWPCCPPVSWPQTGSGAAPGVAMALAELPGDLGTAQGQLPHAGTQ